MFYQILYHNFAPGTPVKAFSLDMDVKPVIERWNAVGKPLDPRGQGPFRREPRSALVRVSPKVHRAVVGAFGLDGPVIVNRLRVALATPIGSATTARGARR